MNSIKRDQLLVAYDNSKESQKALEQALEIAEPEDEILVLMVIPEPNSDLFFDESSDISKTKLQMSQELESLKSKYKYSNNHLETKLSQGNIIEEILKTSDNPRCKLIVLGYKGATRVGKFMLGSISGEVAKRAKVPVLVIK